MRLAGATRALTMSISPNRAETHVGSLIHWQLPSMERIRVCAVSYLNTVPLVWGMLHGPQKAVFELLRHPWGTVPGVGIACRGAVRSILLITKCAREEIRTLAADTSSRTSVALARVILAGRYGAHPEFVPHPPDRKS